MGIKIRLKTIEDVKDFCKTAMKIPSEVYVTEGRCRVDGKSLMGLFSLDLSNPILVEVDSQYADEFTSIGGRIADDK